MSASCYANARLQLGSPAVARLLQHLLCPSRNRQVCRGCLRIPSVPAALLIGLLQGRARCVYISSYVPLYTLYQNHNDAS